ncbi:hypothetical protein M2451_001282 [Dysgonomonas sp. PFB1-18]|nr:hypothetical protein [Dysgonomonas sp. PF1-14]MDH6338587.1 hypothetical protein [Dysgonomonas sp. PF1-16]MDH6379965.1 hypothetical protein [Dysgonomonas sp. PFB1-18]MDH6397415.1 hypothetical protein [Dysgonomonas sp. PF1-23]
MLNGGEASILSKDIFPVGQDNRVVLFYQLPPLSSGGTRLII